MMLSIRKLTLCVCVLFALPGCGNTSPTDFPTVTSIGPTPLPSLTPARKQTFTPPPTQAPTPTPTASRQASTLYLGQITPGMEAEIFAPEIVSDPGFSEYSGAFSPDGSEYYFYRFSDDLQATLMFSRLSDETWTDPEPLGFTKEYAAFEPYIGFDNQRLYFAWSHPNPSGQNKLPAYYFVERTQDGWSEPEYAGEGMFLSSSRDGQFYTTDVRTRLTDGKTYLAKITIDQGVFTNYERLPIQDHFGYQAHPCIAPDGSYILFDVSSGSHLFVSFKNADGTWGDAIDLTRHGFEPRAGGAYISPDGEYLFFSLRGDIWWVDIGVIEKLKPAE